MPTPSSGGDAAPPEVAALRQQASRMLGVDLFDPINLATLGPDARRRIVMSWGIVDPEMLRALLASPVALTRDGHFAIRSRVTLPVVDASAAAVALERLPLQAECARPGVDGASRAWIALLARIPDPEDRRAAETAHGAYVCASETQAIVARVDRARNEIRWTLSLAYRGVMAAAAGPFSPASPESGRLVRDGFLAANVAYRATPDDEARFAAAVLLFKEAAGLSGLDPEMRPAFWKRGVAEVGSYERLVNSPPRLFTEIVMMDGVTSWGLTPEGEKTFASLGLPTSALREQVRAGIAQAVQPGGAFTTDRDLADTVHLAGDYASHLFEHFLWPHAAAFAAAHPAAGPILPPMAPLLGDRMELDRARHRLWLRP